MGGEITVVQLLKDVEAFAGRQLTVSGLFVVDWASNCYLTTARDAYERGEVVCLRGLDGLLTKVALQVEPVVGGPAYVAEEAVVKGQFKLYEHYRRLAVIDPVHSIRIFGADVGFDHTFTP